MLLIAALGAASAHAAGQTASACACRPSSATSSSRSITARAPITAANFLKYVDAGHYDGGTWHRTVKMDNQPESTDQDRGDPGGRQSRQGEGRVSRDSRSSAPASPASCTRTASISMARGMPDSATSGLVHLHQRSAVARLRRDAQSRRPGLRRVRPRRLGHGRRAQDPAGASSTDRKTNTEAQRLTPPIKITKVARVRSRAITRVRRRHATAGAVLVRRRRSCHRRSIGRCWRAIAIARRRHVAVGRPSPSSICRAAAHPTSPRPAASPRATAHRLPVARRAIGAAGRA